MNALQIALRYLEKRARTEKELRDKLAQRQVAPTEIDEIVAKLKSYGYINDQKFVIDYQRYRNDFKPMGVQRLKMELYQKGVNKEAMQLLQASKEEERQLALAAAESRLRLYSKLEPSVFERRMTGFLARRGFSYETIKYVLSRLA